MSRRSHRRTLDPQDIAAEIIRRATGSTGDGSRATAHVIRLARPPSLQERLQLMAARLQRRPIVIMRHGCADMDEWLARYGAEKDR
jgi:hypothetical protein